MRERALRELGLAPGWVRRHAALPGQGEASNTTLPPPATSNQAVAFIDQPPVQVGSFDLAALRSAIERCEACPRAFERSRAVVGEGAQALRLMVIDHVPSRHDASNGALSDTDVARLFDQLLFSVGLKRDAVYLTHALRCDGALPTPDEAMRCNPYLQREVELIAPRAVLALGTAAGDAIKRHAAVGAPRVFVVPHPQDMLSDAVTKRAAWSTLRELRAYLAEG